MDDIVKQALAKWPNVPDCYGWLGLDARGDWYMRDDAVQAAGDFAKSKGSKLQHEKLIEFIGRNYDADANGNWFFQNGPQRVYVELEVDTLGLAFATRWHFTQPYPACGALPRQLARRCGMVVSGNRFRLWFSTQHGHAASCAKNRI